MTQGISFTKEIAPVMWYKTGTSRICSQGIGMFSSSFSTAWGMYLRALIINRESRTSQRWVKMYTKVLIIIIFNRILTFHLSLPKVHPLVMAKLSVGHVSMVSDDLPDMLGWHVFLLCINKPKLSLFWVAFCLQLLPFPCWIVGKRTLLNNILLRSPIIPKNSLS